jgi:K+:H+ antiporter
LPAEDFSHHVVVAGYGRTGRAVTHALREAGVGVALIELDHSLFGDAAGEGFHAIWGDATREEILRAAGVTRATTLVITTPDQTMVRMSAETARRLNSSLTVIARAVRAHHVAELRALGVDVAIQPEFEGGVEMVRAALIRCGQGNEEALRIAAKLRADLYGAAS